MTTSETSDNKRKLRRIAMILFIVGLVLLFIHYLFLRGQQVHNDENWLITLDMTHTVKKAGTIISIQPPYESNNIRLIGRNIKHAGLHITPPIRNAISKRAIRLRANQPGVYQAEIVYSLQFSELAHFYEALPEKLNTQKRQFFLADNEWLQLNIPALEVKLSDIGVYEVGQDKMVELIFKFVRQLSNNNPSSFRHVSNILATHSANYRERALLMVALCRKAGIPSRIITGFELKDNPSSDLDYWVEVYVDDRWTSYHPGLGYQNNLPVNYVAFDKQGDGIVSGAIKASTLNAKDYVFTHDISIERQPVNLHGANVTRSEWQQIFMLDRLSSDTRESLSLLMLLPLGALFCASIRQIAGLHSYGIFTPTILALAMTYAEIETTALILIITLTLVYFGRPTYHHEVSRTPRLSIIFTLVATSMVIGVSILDYFSLVTDGHLVLLPIVIITSLIDRFFSTLEARGSQIAFIRLVWTSILTISVLPILQLSWLGGLILRYPEIHLFTLSMLILVSVYPFGKHKLPPWLGVLSEPDKKVGKENNKIDNVS